MIRVWDLGWRAIGDVSVDSALLALADPMTEVDLDDFLDQDELVQTLQSAEAATYGEQVVLEFPTSSTARFAPAVDRFREAVAEGRVAHAGDADLTSHVLNARLHRTRTRVEHHDSLTLTKPSPGRLIDGAVAAVLAYEAHAQAPPPPRQELMMAWA